MMQANAAIAELQGKVDTLIVVSNDKLLQIVPAGTPLMDSFLVADDILRQVGISAYHYLRRGRNMVPVLLLLLVCVRLLVSLCHNRVW